MYSKFHFHIYCNRTTSEKFGLVHGLRLTRLLYAMPAHIIRWFSHPLQVTADVFRTKNSLFQLSYCTLAFFNMIFWGGGAKLYNHRTFHMSNEAHHSVTETATGWTTISTFKPTGGTHWIFYTNCFWILSTEGNALEGRIRPLIAF
jgi:hypothetical protein